MGLDCGPRRAVGVERTRTDSELFLRTLGGQGSCAPKCCSPGSGSPRIAPDPLITDVVAGALAFRRGEVGGTGAPRAHLEWIPLLWLRRLALMGASGSRSSGLPPAGRFSGLNLSLFGPHGAQCLWLLLLESDIFLKEVYTLTFHRKGPREFSTFPS